MAGAILLLLSAAVYLMGRVINSPLADVMNAGFIGRGVLFLLAVLLLAPWCPDAGAVSRF
jgi:hypothetical protein